MENKELIEIKRHNGINVIDARELFYRLALKKTATKFTDWIQNQLNLVEALENEDFFVIRFKTNFPSEARFKTEYLLTVDIAKEICMVIGVLPRTNKEARALSKKIRRYFIDCEKRLAPANNCQVQTGVFAGSTNLLMDLTENELVQIVTNWKMQKKFPSLTPQQVDGCLRLIPLYPRIKYTEIARAVCLSCAMITLIKDYMQKLGV